MEDGIAMSQRTKDCPACGGKGTATLSRYCGAWVCDCGNHVDLARCFCGWSVSGHDGRRELEEMGETIDPDDWPYLYEPEYF